MTKLLFIKKIKFIFIFISILLIVAFSVVNFYLFHLKFFSGYKGPSLIINPFISEVYDDDINVIFKNFYYSCTLNKSKPTILVDDFTYQFFKSNANVVSMSYLFLSFNIIKHNKLSFEKFVKKSVNADCASAKCGTFQTFLLPINFRINGLCFYNFTEDHQ